MYYMYTHIYIYIYTHTHVVPARETPQVHLPLPEATDINIAIN